MTSARLLVVALLLFPFLAFAQDKQQTPAADPSAGPKDSSPSNAITEEQKSELMRKALAGLQARDRLDPDSQHSWIIVTPDGKVTWGVDADCYTIRSYVVARDAKDSDSTHLVRSSTCQPASRYQMKNADMRRDSGHK